MTSGKAIFKATAVVSFFILLSRALGLARDVVIARQFGATFYNDAYVSALKVPTMIFTVVSGALVTATVPVFTEYASAGRRREAWRVFEAVAWAITLLYAAGALLGMAAAPLLVKLVVPGFAGEVASLTADLARILLPVMVFTGLASLFSGLLNANQIFGLPAFSNSVNNLCIIAAAFFLGRTWGVYGLAAGTVAAAAAMAAVQLPALVKAGFSPRPVFDFRHPGTRKVFVLALPSAAGIAVNQLSVYVTGVLASWLPEGSISALNYADRLVQFPVSLFVLALGTAVFPALSERAAAGDRGAFAATLDGSLKAVISLIVPVAAGAAVLHYPVVALIYRRGAFDERAVALTSTALLFYSLGLVGQAAGILLTRGFYSIQDTRTPVAVSLAVFVLNTALSLALTGPLKHAGLALASALSSLAYMALLYRLLSRRVPELAGRGTASFAARVTAASLLMALSVWALDTRLAAVLGGATAAALAVRLCAAVLLGILVYGAAAVLWVREIRALARRAGSELARRAGRALGRCI